jgi:hypothetical protein
VLLTIAEYCVRVRVKLGSVCLGLQIAGSCATNSAMRISVEPAYYWTGVLAPSPAAYRYTHHRGG